MTEQQRRWRIRTAVDEDYKLASMLRKVFSDGDEGSAKRSCEEEYYRWKIQKNPVQEGLFHVATDHDVFAGMLTVVPRRVRIKGATVTGAEICDAFVHPDYQRQGMFAAFVNVSREKAHQNGLDFVYSCPIEQTDSLAGFRKSKLVQVPSVGVFNLVCPLNAFRIIRNRLHLRVLPDAVCDVLDPVAALAYRSVYSVRPPARREDSLRISQVASFGEDVATLCEKTSAQYDWMVERSLAYLDWRFVKNPDTYALWVAHDGRETVGYMVLKSGTWRNLNVGFIADFLTDEGRPDVFRRLVLHAMSVFRKASMDMVSAWAVSGGLYYSTLEGFGFRRQKQTVVLCIPNEIGRQVAGEPLKWHFTMADADNI